MKTKKKEESSSSDGDDEGKPELSLKHQKLSEL